MSQYTSLIYSNPVRILLEYEKTNKPKYMAVRTTTTTGTWYIPVCSPCSITNRPMSPIRSLSAKISFYITNKKLFNEAKCHQLVYCEIPPIQTHGPPVYLGYYRSLCVCLETGLLDNFIGGPEMNSTPPTSRRL